MSIGLYISYRSPQKEDALIPIASDYIFSTHWKPICEELHLRWVPRFQNGWMLSVQDTPHILAELDQLRRYLACGETHVEISHHMLARISVLMRELNEVQKNMDADAFVGSPYEAQRRAAAFHRKDLAARQGVVVRPSIRPAATASLLITNHVIVDPKAMSETLRTALENPAPVDRFVDPLPGTVCSADNLPKTRPSWIVKLRSILSHLWGGDPQSVPANWRTSLDDF